jgi:tetratricopeptide (TPR) repeat protein
MHKSGIEPLVLNWNKLAMENLREENYSEALRLLQKAEELLKYPDGNDSSKLLGITYNNFGCFYKKYQKYSMALKYLFKALDIEINSVFDKTNLGGTHLNICAVYSAINQHSKALSHGISSVKLLKEASEIDKSLSTMTSLVVALHNTGLEYELLRDFSSSKETYKCAMDLAIRNLGSDHPITGAVSKSYYNLQSKSSETYFKVRSSIQDKKSNQLPSLKTLSARNKSVESNSKLSSRVSRNGQRTTSNKTINSNKTTKKELPLLPKPKTVKKRSKKIINDLKVQGLEDKILELQNQISLFQQKYKDFEKNTFEPKVNGYNPRLTKIQAAIKIQRFWRNIKKPKTVESDKKSPGTKARLAINELESLKQEIFKENNLNILTPYSYTNSNAIVYKSPIMIKENNFIDMTTKNFKNNRIQKNIKIPLEPIMESKIETKEMKAILIQSCIRKFLARNNYKKIRRAIIKIQKQFRRYQCEYLYKFIRKAIIHIQTAWRAYKKTKKSNKNPLKKCN